MHVIIIIIIKVVMKVILVNFPCSISDACNATSVIAFWAVVPLRDHNWGFVFIGNRVLLSWIKSSLLNLNKTKQQQQQQQQQEQQYYLYDQSKKKYHDFAANRQRVPGLFKAVLEMIFYE